MKNIITLLFLCLINFNLFGMEGNSAEIATIEEVVGKLQWATVTNIRTLEFMEHTRLYRLVPRGVLMENYGLPIVAGSSIMTGAFDKRNGKALSGNIVTSAGAIADLAKIGGMCGFSMTREKIVESLNVHLMSIERKAEIGEWEIPVAQEILRHLNKLAYEDVKGTFPNIELRLGQAMVDRSIPETLHWNPDEFFDNEDQRPSFPVAFASTSLCELKQAFGSGCPYEHLVEKELELGFGKDIAYVFAPKAGVEYTNILLNKMFQVEAERPILISFEDLHHVLTIQNAAMIAKIPSQWHRYSDEQTKQLFKEDQDKERGFLPAFLSENNPLVLVCKSAQFEEVLELLKQRELKPVNIRSPVAPSISSLVLKGPLRVELSTEQANLLANEWLGKLRDSLQDEKFMDGQDIDLDKVIIEIEIGS